MIATATGEKPDISLAQQRLTDLLAPASRTILAQALAVLWEECAKREEAELNLDLRVETYVARLSAFPADIALFALRSWPSIDKWWPAWKELEDLCERLYQRRRGFLPALQAFKALPAPEPAGEKSDEDREAVRDILRRFKVKATAAMAAAPLPAKPNIMQQRIALRKLMEREAAEAKLHPETQT